MKRHALLLAAILTLLPGLGAAQSVVTYHGSLTRHGHYVVPKLTLDAAASTHLDHHFKTKIEGHIYAQPLYWLPPGETSGRVIVATESNSVYALDAATGATIWKVQLGHSVARSQLPCGNIDPDGITGTPVIDDTAGVLYLDALSNRQAGPRHLIYALSLSDGSVLPNWPIDVQEKLGKQGITFSSSTQGERSALLLFNGNLYVNYGGNWGDCGSYNGTVIRLQVSPPRVVAHWATRANGGGVWAQGGVAGDGKALYFTTGNTFGASNWSDGEAIIRLKPGLQHSDNTRDYFAPSNWKTLDDEDADLGGTEALPLDIAVANEPAAKRVIAFGKDGNAYLADRTNLGGIGGQIAVKSVANGAIITAPAVLQTASQTMVAFTSSSGSGCSGNNVTALNIAPSGSSPISVAWCALFSGGGAPIVTTTPDKANAIVWVVGAEGDNLLHGFDASSGKAVFTGGGAQMSGLRHFATILPAQKHLYVAADNQVYAFSF